MFEDVNLFGEPVEPEKHGSALSATWEYPPFSVLSARDGWWQERKRQWLALGIQSELGRGGASGQQAHDVRNGSTPEAFGGPSSVAGAQ